MAGSLFETHVDLNCSQQDLFNFILVPANLQAISPPELDFYFVSAPDVISLGSHLTCRVQSFGGVKELEYVIAEFEAGKRYREEMIRGPFSRWIHDYIVEALDGNRSRLVNRIEFDTPGGIMGLLMTPAKVLESLDDGFTHRQKVLKKQFGC